MENNDKQTIIYNIKGNMNNYPTAATVNNYYYNQPNSYKEDVEEAPVDELSAILKDKELYKDIVAWAKTCKQPKDIRSRICTTLKERGIKDFGYQFINALIPHLTAYEGSMDIENLQRQLY